MPVRYIEWLKRGEIRANPDQFYVFGDNVQRVGFGGQAAEARGEPNALGVATLYAPGRFYGADPDVLLIILADLAGVAKQLHRGRIVNVPRAGLGTGLGRLIEHRPDIHNLIVSFFRAADGEPCPWELI